MTLRIPDTNYIQDAGRTVPSMKTLMEQWRDWVAELPGGSDKLIVTLATDVMGLTDGIGEYWAAAQTGITDNLLRITPGLTTEDRRLITVRADAGDTITFKHSGGGSGQLTMLGGADKAITGDQEVTLRYSLSGDTWKEVNQNWIALFPQTSGSKFWGTPAGGGSGHWAARILAATDLDAGNLMDQIIGWKALTQITLASDKLTPTASSAGVIELDSEGAGASDTFSLIVYANWPAGRVMMVVPKAGETFTVTHNASPGGGEAAIILQDGVNKTLDGNKALWLLRKGNTFYEVANSGFPVTPDTRTLGFGGPMALTSLRALPTSGTWDGDYFNVGAWVSSGNVTGSLRARIYNVGNWTLNHDITITPELAGGLSPSAVIAVAGTTCAGPGRGIGHGMGAIAYNTYRGGGGGGFGGLGGRGAGDVAGSETPGGSAYHIAHQMSGSSGGGGGRWTTAGGTSGNGGDGGGSLYLEVVGAIVLNGNITGVGTAGVAGTGSTDGGGGGGSGAGVDMRCTSTWTLNAAKAITLTGGAGGAGGSGGAMRLGGGGGAGGYCFVRAGGAATVTGSVTLTGGGAGTSTSAGQAATAGATGVSDIVGSVGWSRRSAA